MKKRQFTGVRENEAYCRTEALHNDELVGFIIWGAMEKRKRHAALWCLLFIGAWPWNTKGGWRP